MNSNYLKGRGSQSTISNQFEQFSYENVFDDFVHLGLEEHHTKPTTEFITTYPKSIVNKVKSSDLKFMYSMNPYQGCEHGCVYCYARNSHEYWGYNAGLDFEQKILVKKNAPKLLKAFLSKKSWEGLPIMLSGNTDCYQPAEKQFQITRDLLSICLHHKQAVGIITKNALLLRDLDLLKELATLDLIRVNLSITSMDNDLKNLLEPRTSSIAKRFEAVKTLSDHGIPVNVMIAPIIPSINNQDIMKIAEKAAENGARNIHYTFVRLNGHLGKLFTDWIQKTMPDRADKVLNQIKDARNGKLSESAYFKRMQGSGHFSKEIDDLFQLARRKYFQNQLSPSLNTALYLQNKNRQLKLNFF